MIQLTTVLNVADNSGARKLFCIQVMGGSRRKWGTIGDVIVASVREAIPNSNIAKGSVVKAVIVRTRKEVRRRDGFNILMIIVHFYMPLTKYLSCRRFNTATRHLIFFIQAGKFKIGRAHV